MDDIGGVMDLTDQGIEEATKVANELLVKLLDEADETGEDMDAVCYALWGNLTCILAAAGWTADELVDDVAHYVEC